MADTPLAPEPEEKEFFLDENERPVRCRRERWSFAESLSQLGSPPMTKIKGIPGFFLAMAICFLWEKEYFAAFFFGAPAICWLIWWCFFRWKGPHDWTRPAPPGDA